ALRIFSLQRDRRLPAATLGRVAALAIVARFVGGDAEQPRLKLALAVERLEVANDGQKNFLADFLGIFACKIRRQLENDTPGGRVVPIEQFVPRFSLAAATTRQQFSFRAHDVSTLAEWVSGAK